MRYCEKKLSILCMNFINPVKNNKVSLNLKKKRVLEEIGKLKEIKWRNMEEMVDIKMGG